MPAARAIAQFRLSAWVANAATNDPLIDGSCLPDRSLGRQASEVLNVRAERSPEKAPHPAALARSFNVLVSASGAGQTCKR